MMVVEVVKRLGEQEKELDSEERLAMVGGGATQVAEVVVNGSQSSPFQTYIHHVVQGTFSMQHLENWAPII